LRVPGEWVGAGADVGWGSGALARQLVLTLMRLCSGG
jgi:hypothetical protein